MTAPAPAQRLFLPAELTRRAVLEPLVRDELGCTCPDAVFEHIVLPSGPSDHPGDWPEGVLVGVGGRLLILLVEDWRPAELAPRLAAVYARARALRDAGGYNRFRLVLAVADGVDTASLETAFADLALPDERLHLHLVPAAAVRARLAGRSA